MICKVGAGETECSVQAFPSENIRIEDLLPGDEFELELKVLGFDSLYQRVLFGQVAKDSGLVEPEESEYENAAKLEALSGVMAERVSQLQEADKAQRDTVRIQTECRPFHVESLPFLDLGLGRSWRWGLTRRSRSIWSGRDSRTR